MSTGHSKQYHVVQATEAGALETETPGAGVQGRTDTKKRGDAISRRIQILSIVQSTLSSILSLIIAVWQGKVYVTYQQTKNEPGAWPAIPNLVPTLLLFIVAIAAFIFDICMLLAYTMPGKKLARRAMIIGNGAYYIVTSAKTVSYAISSAITKTSFDFGNATNQNADLWSWTCTDQAATKDSITQAEANCNFQEYSYYFALVQLGVEAFKWLINALAWWQQRNEMEDRSPEGRAKRFQEYSQGVDGQLADLTPQFN
ncbi:hypothetical protein GQ53DRAFT_814636 [Thozetella sp. PMI_491]|nr:hypothetical protein GQ53DRAFT_814636 [Thozetella sp. PMI_491]